MTSIQRTPTLAITRARSAARAFVDLVTQAWGAPLDVVISPAIRIDPLKDVDLPKAAHLILTSVNGANWAQARGLTASKVWCVGDKTAQAAAGIGQIHSAQGGAKELTALIRAANPHKPMLHLVGAHQHGDLAADLRAAGLDCTARVVYQQSLQPPTPQLLKALRGTAPLIAPVFSARSALIFAQQERQAPMHGIAMSGHVADALVDLEFDTVTTAVLPNAASMAEATVKVLNQIIVSRI